MKISFRPLSGFSIFKSGLKAKILRLYGIVSVPSRGSLSSNAEDLIRNMSDKLFPSPLGVLYLQIAADIVFTYISHISFRPLSGFSIFKSS